MENTRRRWVVSVNGEIRYTTETDNRSEAETWADHNLEPETSYEVIATTPELEETDPFVF